VDVTLFKNGVPIRTINDVVNIQDPEPEVYTDFIMKVGHGETASNQVDRTEYDFFVAA